jgi:hypothetical protein
MAVVLSEGVIAVLKLIAEAVGGWLMVDKPTGQPVPWINSKTCTKLALDGRRCSYFRMKVPRYKACKLSTKKEFNFYDVKKATTEEVVVWATADADKDGWMFRGYDPEENQFIEEFTIDQTVDFEDYQVTIQAMADLKNSLFAAGKVQDAMTLQSALTYLSDNPRPCTQMVDGSWVTCEHHPAWRAIKKASKSQASDKAKAAYLAKYFIRPGQPWMKWKFPKDGEVWTYMDFLMAWVSIHNHANVLMTRYGYTKGKAMFTAKRNFIEGDLKKKRDPHKTFKLLNEERKEVKLPEELWKQASVAAWRELRKVGVMVPIEDACYVYRLVFTKVDNPKLNEPAMRRVLGLMAHCPMSHDVPRGKRPQQILLGRGVDRRGFITSWPTAHVCAGEFNGSGELFNNLDNNYAEDLVCEGCMSCEHEECLQEYLFDARVVETKQGPKVRLYVTNEGFMSEETGELAIEFLATNQALGMKPHSQDESDEKEALHWQIEVGSQEKEIEDLVSVEEERDRDAEAVLVMDAADRPIGVFLPSDIDWTFGVPELKTPDQWVERQARIQDKLGDKGLDWREAMGYPVDYSQHIVHANGPNSVDTYPMDKKEVKGSCRVALTKDMCPVFSSQAYKKAEEERLIHELGLHEYTNRWIRMYGFVGRLCV